jgi:phosphoribosyl 1,2-cyclic phosphate phosphodiesterase
LSFLTVTMLGSGGSAGSPQIGGADGSGDWGELDPAEPRNRRTRPSIVITSPAGKNLLVDTGPDLRLQLTACKIPRIDAVLYTHSHADHIAGLDEIRILNRLLDAPMPAYAEANCWEELRARFDYAFRPWNGGSFFRPVLETHVVEPGQVVEILGMQVRLIGQDHGYVRSLGLRVEDFAYCTDVKRLDEAALAALDGVQTLIVDCFTRREAHPTHANLDQVLEWVAQLRPARTILTHLGPSMDWAWGRANLPTGVELGFDGLRLGFG